LGVGPTSNMKKTSLLRSLVLTAVFTTGSFAAETFRPFMLELTPGSSSVVVQKTLGVPSAKMGQDLWVYFNFTHGNPNAVTPAFDTLVVAFENNRVVAVKVTDGRVVRQLLAQHKAQSVPAAVAAK